MDILLDTYDQSKLNQDIINILHRYVKNNKIKALIKYVSTKNAYIQMNSQAFSNSLSISGYPMEHLPGYWLSLFMPYQLAPKYFFPPVGS